MYCISDRDGDEQLTEDEFADLPSEGAGVDQSLSMPVIQERREEFRHLIDKNKNGKADRSELLVNISFYLISIFKLKYRSFKDQVYSITFNFVFINVIMDFFFSLLDLHRSTKSKACDTGSSPLDRIVRRRSRWKAQAPGDTQ